MLNLLKIYLLAGLLAFINPAIGDYMSGQTYAPPPTGYTADTKAQKPEPYGRIIATKLGSGISNIGLCFLELPKNVINTTNEANLALGLTGGVLKGVLHMLGRGMSGSLDMLTFPVPSVPIPAPAYPWQNYKTETQYNPLFKMKN